MKQATRKRRMPPEPVVVVLPPTNKCPYCARFYDRTVPFINAGGVDVAYVHVDAEHSHYCYSPLHMRSTDVELDSYCLYEDGGEHEPEPDAEGDHTASSGV